MGLRGAYGDGDHGDARVLELLELHELHLLRCVAVLGDEAHRVEAVVACSE